MDSFCYDYAVIGGDLRQVYLAQELAKERKKTCYYALCSKISAPAREISATPAPSLEAAISNSARIICPIPLSREGNALNQTALKKSIPLKQLLSALSQRQRLFAGCIPDDFSRAASEKGTITFDLMQDPTLACFNTVATAEGVICEAIRQSPVNLQDSRCAVLGYGKCGRTLTDRLKRMLCHVAVVSVVENERAAALPFADETLSFSSFCPRINEYDFIFNTIPAILLKKEELSHTKPSVTILDIASAPGGVDLTAAKELSRAAMSCPSLPGRYSPLSSARAILRSIKNR